ncbi:MurR/RpiR family transcriptional regulator [Mycoplasma todarodis]|uniref:MurR/RpiR family transcriptional regulator n=1 Tax=Mycoplasma todarodis TaxID=1937191 RepID=UPI003B333259
MLKTRISTNKNEYTKSERKIADYILSNYNNKTGELSITQLAKLLSVSPAGITRFCQKLKMRGFKEFQNELLTELELTGTKHSNGLPSTLQEILISLEKTNEILNYDELTLVANKIFETNNVFVYGEAFTHLMAQTLSRKLNKINIASTCYNVASDIGMILPKENSVHIFVSTTGQNPNIRRVVKKICANQKTKKQIIVSLTASRTTNIEDFENAHINGVFYDAMGDDSFELPSVSAIVIQYIMDALFAEVYSKNKELNDKIIHDLSSYQRKK